MWSSKGGRGGWPKDHFWSQGGRGGLVEPKFGSWDLWMAPKCKQLKGRVFKIIMFWQWNIWYMICSAGWRWYVFIVLKFMVWMKHKQWKPKKLEKLKMQNIAKNVMGENPIFYFQWWLSPSGRLFSNFGYNLLAKGVTILLYLLFIHQSCLICSLTLSSEFE